MTFSALNVSRKRWPNIWDAIMRLLFWPKIKHVSLIWWGKESKLFIPLSSLSVVHHPCFPVRLWWSVVFLIFFRRISQTFSCSNFPWHFSSLSSLSVCFLFVLISIDLFNIGHAYQLSARLEYSFFSPVSRPLVVVVLCKIPSFWNTIGKTCINNKILVSSPRSDLKL